SKQSPIQRYHSFTLAFCRLPFNPLPSSKCVLRDFLTTTFAWTPAKSFSSTRSSRTLCSTPMESFPWPFADQIPRLYSPFHTKPSQHLHQVPATFAEPLQAHMSQNCSRGLTEEFEEGKIIISKLWSCHKKTHFPKEDRAAEDLR
ncbi:hypothetical protein AAFF_G00352370, partial [Aldrovandia affinis]